MTGVEAVLLTIVTASTPLLLAALGELVVERSGVLNLGVEGMMIVGAVAGFAIAYATGSAVLGVLAAAIGGAALSLVFAVPVLLLATNQYATGLALTLFGLGLSGMIGEGFVGTPGIRLDPIAIPALSELPFVGRLVFGQDVLVYFAFFMVAAVAWFLFRSRWGLVLRAVGDNHTSAHALGYSVVRVRFLAVMFGGAMAGLGGGYLSLVYTPQWVEGMTAGRGWIALALVVFASWLPLRALIGAYLFGSIMILQFHAQAAEIDVPAQFMSMLPYLATIVVLVIISRDATRIRLNTPACLGRPFVPDR